MAKPRVNIRLSTKLHARLEAEASRPGVTKAQIVEQALLAWFSPEADASRQDMILKALDGLEQKQSAIEYETALTFETLAHFIYYWLTRVEPIPDGERDVAHALGRRRLDYFMEQVVQKMASPRADSRRGAEL